MILILKKTLKKADVWIPLIWTVLCLSTASLNLKSIDYLFPLFSWQLFSEFPEPYSKTFLFTSSNKLDFKNRYDLSVKRNEKKRLWKLGNQIAKEKSPSKRDALVKEACAILKGHRFQLETVKFVPSVLYLTNNINEKKRSEQFECF